MIDKVMNFFRSMDKIESLSSRNSKIEILKQFADDEFAKFYFETVFNPYLTYGVYPSAEDLYEGFKERLELPILDQLKYYREMFVKRQVTGNDAKKRMDNSCLIVEHSLYIKWITRMWNRDLKCGVSVGTINKVFPNLIPSFDVALCNSFEYIEGQTNEFPDWMSRDSKYFIENKIDGFRCICVCKNDTFIFYSKNGKVLNNTDNIQNVLSGMIDRYFESNLRNDCIDNLKEKSIVFDGEIVSTDWENTASIVMSEFDHPKKHTLNYIIFDIMGYSNWIEKKTTHLWGRSCDLKGFFSCSCSFNDSLIKRVERYPINLDNFKNAEERLNKFIADGYEGAVLKKMDSQYSFGRSSDWIKWKKFKTFDLEVTSIFAGNIGTKYEKSMGGVICDYNGIDVRVGGGWSDDQRKFYFENQNQIIGKCIEIAAQESTKYGSLRFPRFLRMRDDK